MRQGTRHNSRGIQGRTALTNTTHSARRSASEDVKSMSKGLGQLLRSWPHAAKRPPGPFAMEFPRGPRSEAASLSRDSCRKYGVVAMQRGGRDE
jgi:hypothetical protein